MRRFYSFGLFALLAVSPVALTVGSASAATWELDASHSNIGFAVRHMTVSNVHGNFTKATGTLEFDDKHANNSKVDVEIDVASVDTREADRDKHLKGPDFFDVEKYPKMTFKSKRVLKDGKGYKVIGDLTIKDVTKSVELKVSEVSKPVKDPWGKTRTGASAKTTINRKDFGLTWNKTLDAGGVAVGDLVTIEIEGEFVQK